MVFQAFGRACEVNEALVRQLHRCEFLERAENVVLVGGPGTGKSHIATALAVAFRHLLLHDLPEEEQESLLPTLNRESGRAFRAMMLGLARLPGGRFTGPVLCLSGRHDRIISQRASAAIARHYDATHEVFDVGHWLIARTAVKRVAGCALQWIARRMN